MNNIQDDCPIGEVAEARKKRFLQLVEQLAHLRDLQYGKNCAQETIEHAKKVAARNLPLNVIRASAIIVDYFYGFPPNWGEFVNPPEWVLRPEKLLSEEQRGSLVCTGFKKVSDLEEDDVVVLILDLPEHGLFAGMAGIIKELLPENDNGRQYLIEFGESEVEVSLSFLRTPRPGDFLDLLQA